MGASHRTASTERPEMNCRRSTKEKILKRLFQQTTEAVLLFIVFINDLSLVYILSYVFSLSFNDFVWCFLFGFN